MIEFGHIEKSFGDNRVLKDICVSLIQEGITAILGPNGSGKTTLIKCLLGMVHPDSGFINYNNENVLNCFKYREHISYLPQNVALPSNLTALECIQLIKELRTGKTRENEIIEIFSLESELGKKLGVLSGGTKQKVNILLALMFDLPTIILDEPTSGLDPLSTIKLKNYLIQEKNKGKHIFITTHIMNFAEVLADYIIFILNGQIYFEGKSEDLLSLKNQSNLETAIAAIIEEQEKQR